METVWSWKSLLITETKPWIIFSARTPNRVRPDIGHAFNFSDRNTNTKINGRWKKRVMSRYWDFFNQSIRAVWKPRLKHSEKLKARDNKKVITEKHELLARWKGNFTTLNCHQWKNMLLTMLDKSQSSTRHANTQSLKKWIKLSLCTVTKSLLTLKDCMQIFYETRLIEVLSTIGWEAWENLKFPANWNDAQLVNSFKKGYRHDCSNNSGI